MHFDLESMKQKARAMRKDVEDGQFTATSWLWVITGGLLGLVASCINLEKKGTKPILARFDGKSKNRIGGIK